MGAMSLTQELMLAKEQATDIKLITYWWKVIKEMEYLGSLNFNGTYRNYYKTGSGRYYYKEMTPEDYKRRDYKR